MMRWMLGASVLVLCGLMSACGGGSGSSPQAKGSVKVGLIVTGSSVDGGWNQLAADSLAKIAGPEKIETKVLQNVTQDKAADAIRQFESQGYDLVIAHGYEYLDAAKELTDPSKPTAVKIKIAVSGGDVDKAPFESLLYDLGPASYQLGVIAAKVSKTGKIGFIGGQPFPTVTAMQRGFDAGARSVNPAIVVTAVYTDNWDNPAIAKQKAEGLIAAGVDVIMQNVDAASSGVFEAVKEENGKAKEQKGAGVPSVVYTFGANSDQNDNKVCPEYTLASAAIKMDVAFAAVVKQVKDGTFKGGLVKEDVANGVAVAVINPKLAGTVIDAATQKLVEDAGKKLASGEVKIPQK
ncbi:MAG TPA: BMP family protein [Phycisphaerae bacterium]